MIKKFNLSPSERDFLRRSQCAYYGYPYVCCPNDNFQNPSQQQQPDANSQQSTTGLRASDLPPPGQCGSHLSDRIVGGIETQVIFSKEKYFQLFD